MGDFALLCHREARPKRSESSAQNTFHTVRDPRRSVILAAMGMECAGEFRSEAAVDRPVAHAHMTGAALPSRHAANRCLSDIRPALEAIRSGGRPDPLSLVWPAGLDRNVLRELSLEVRTRNCLMAERLMEGDSPLTTNDVLRVPNFGWKSLTDLLLTTEDFLKHCMRVGSTGSPLDTGSAGVGTPGTREEGTVSETGAERRPTSRERVIALLSELFATAAELYGVRTLADGLSEETLRLAKRMGSAEEIEAVRIDEMVGAASGLLSVISSRLEQTVDAASEMERMIIAQRLLGMPRATLQEVGSQAGVTRERIRQVQVRLERRIRLALGAGLAVVASTLKDQLGHVASRCDVEGRIEELLSKQQGLGKDLFGRALIEAMGFTLNNGMYLDERGLRELEEIRATTRQLADDVGLVDPDRIEATFPSEEWQKWWPWVREACGLVDLFGSVGIRESGKAWTKAALISIGRPATREEIAEMCGFEKNKTGSHLSVIPSVVKADKDRWGLKEWVDDEYDGIVGEIIQRIHEDGGATTTDRLLRELPEKFGVNPMSVRMYMQTPKFVVDDGWISLASRLSVRLRDLDDVVHGRDENGAPYWTFVVEDRFFDGYSVTGVPPEFAKALGCEPDAGEYARIENLPQCRELSLRWPLASTTGASLGYVADPLRKLGVEAGDRARVTIKGLRLVELGLDDRNAAKPDASEANAILERLMQRRRVL